ncbi:MAG: glycosyltransferase family 25 protein [Paracoccaceae bacterium]
MKSFVIHLRRNTDRTGNVANLLQNLPLAEVVDAVDGQVLDDKALASVYETDLHDPKYPFRMGPNEIACFLSHRKCWQKIVDGGDICALVAEDDLNVDAKLWAPALDVALRNMTPDRIIRFPPKNREKINRKIDQEQGALLFRPSVIGLSAVLHLIGRNAAQQLLDLTEKFDRPVDTYLQMRWHTGIETLSVYPNGVDNNADPIGGSSIQTRLSLKSKLARAFPRQNYRTKVRKLSEIGS